MKHLDRTRLLKQTGVRRIDDLLDAEQLATLRKDLAEMARQRRRALDAAADLVLP